MYPLALVAGCALYWAALLRSGSTTRSLVVFGIFALFVSLYFPALVTVSFGVGKSRSHDALTGLIALPLIGVGGIFGLVVGVYSAKRIAPFVLQAKRVTQIASAMVCGIGVGAFVAGATSFLVRNAGY